MFFIVKFSVWPPFNAECDAYLPIYLLSLSNQFIIYEIYVDLFFITTRLITKFIIEIKIYTVASFFFKIKML